MEPDTPDQERIEAALRRELPGGGRRLRFAPPLEDDFRTHHFHETLPQVRLSLTVGLVAFLAFGILDAVVFPELRPTLWLIRYLVATPPILAVWLYALTPNPRPVLHALYAAIFVGIGAVLLLLLDLTPADKGQLYYPAFILLAFHLLAFSGLRAGTSIPAVWIVFALYGIAEPLAIHSDAIHLANNLGGLFAANIIGSAAAYTIERAQRKAYCNGRLLEIETRRQAELARIDPLTGLANRRRFHEAFPEEWRRARRLGYPLAALMIDIDAFKAYNDTLGHRAGDECLRRVAEAVAEHARRPGDIAARYGGEEFVVLLPGVSSGDTRRLGERIRQSVERLTIRHPDSPAGAVVTVSIGYASILPGPGVGPDTLLHMADEALYRAKEGGRNRVEGPHPGTGGDG